MNKLESVKKILLHCANDTCLCINGSEEAKNALAGFNEVMDRLSSRGLVREIEKIMFGVFRCTIPVDEAAQAVINVIKGEK